MYGERIKELRRERSWSQQQLAEKLACGQRVISSYESEDVEIGSRVLMKLCQVFQVSADYILGLEDETGAKTYR